MHHPQLAAIARYAELSADLATAGQPTEAQLVQALKSGFTVVINLGMHTDPSYALPDEGATVAQHGARYVHIPVHFSAPRLDQFQAFSAAMAEAVGAKVFVHCRHNKRVPVFIALDRIVRQGCNEEQAWSDMRALWEPDEVWSGFIRTVLQACPPP